jgi:hypothetical protein
VFGIGAGVPSAAVGRSIPAAFRSSRAARAMGTAIGRVGRLGRHDDLLRRVHHRLGVVRVVESLVALLHDLRLGVGEVGPRLVRGRGVDRSGSFAPALPAFGFTSGLIVVAAALFLARPGAGLGFQTRTGLADLRPPIFTPLQFLGQFVATTASQRGVLLGVKWLGLLEQPIDLCFQPPDLLGHVAVTHRLVSRGIRTHLGPVGGEIPQLDQAHLAGQARHLEEQRPKRRQVDLAKIADRAEVGRIVADDGSEGQIPLAGGGDLAAGAGPDAIGVDQERDHQGHIERRLAAPFLGVMVVEGREIELRDEIEQEEHQIVFGQRLARRDRLLAALIDVPSAVVLTSIVHDQPLAQRVRALGSA